MTSVGGLNDQCKHHLEQALEEEDPSEKDFHIRNVLQAYVADETPNSIESE